MVVELITVRLHDPSGDDVGKIELPSGWVIEPGDLLASEDGRLVCVARVVLCERGDAVAARVEVNSAVVGT
jgi:urease accessory protein UreE